MGLGPPDTVTVVITTGCHSSAPSGDVLTRKHCAHQLPFVVAMPCHRALGSKVQCWEGKHRSLGGDLGPGTRTWVGPGPLLPGAMQESPLHLVYPSLNPDQRPKERHTLIQEPNN
jgi:hypothetical protein